MTTLLLNGACPDCEGKMFIRGPRGGAAINIKCAECRSCFWYCPPLEPRRIPDVGSECYSGGVITLESLDRLIALTRELTLFAMETGELRAIPDVYAYVGEDEFGGAGIGLKQGDVPAGRIPLAVIESHLHKIRRPHLVAQLQLQVNTYKKPIRLVRYVAVEEILVIKPE